MYDHEAIVVPVVPLDDLGHVYLVREINAARVNQILELMHSKSDPTVKGTHRGDQSILIALLALAYLLIVERLVSPQSSCETSSWLIALIGVGHGERAARDNDKHI